MWGVPEPRDNTREMAAEILIIALYLESQAPVLVSILQDTAAG